MKPTLKWRYYNLKSIILTRFIIFIAKAHTYLENEKIIAIINCNENRNEEQLEEHKALVAEWIKEIENMNKN